MSFTTTSQLFQPVKFYINVTKGISILNDNVCSKRVSLSNQSLIISRNYASLLPSQISNSQGNIPYTLYKCIKDSHSRIALQNTNQFSFQTLSNIFDSNALKPISSLNSIPLLKSNLKNNFGSK